MLGTLDGPAPQSRGSFPPLRSQQHVNHRADEDERGGEDVDPDPRDVGGGVVAHEFHPESAQAVQRDVQREQSTVTDPVFAVDVDQNREDQQIPE